MRTAISHGQWKPCSGQLFRPYWGSSAWHSRRSVTGESPCGCFVFGGPRGAVRCPKTMKTKGKKGSDKMKNKKSRLTYRLKRPPKWEGHPHTEPARHFARESNPASRLVKILLKDYIQYIWAIDEGSSEKRDTHTQAKASQNPRKPQYSQRRRSRGRKEREDTNTLKQKTQSTVQPTKATEGDTLEPHYERQN